MSQIKWGSRDPLVSQVKWRNSGSERAHLDCLGTHNAAQTSEAGNLVQRPVGGQEEKEDREVGGASGRAGPCEVGGAWRGRGGA